MFGQIYFQLYKKYLRFLSDSRKTSNNSKLYILDTTTISLFQEVLRAGGQSAMTGKRKGGIKVHSLIRSDQDVPCMIRFSAGSASDSPSLKKVYLPAGSIIVFDRGYHDFSVFNRFTTNKITWVTRRHRLFAYEVMRNHNVAESQKSKGIISNKLIIHGNPRKKRVKARLIKVYDEDTRQEYEFVTNNLRMHPYTVAELYRKRWQIEILFKRKKQNYPLKYFFGDRENAIKIQIWCALIADLILKIVKKTVAAKWSFSNLAAMVRLHLMTYIQLFKFLKSPEKALIDLFKSKPHYNPQQLILIT